MRDCPHCHQSLGNANVFGDTLAGDVSSWSDAAKVANIAEAGYLACQLNDRGIATRIVESRTFDAMTGEWHTTYLLQTDGGHLSEAIEFLQQEAAAEPEYDDEYDGAGSSLPAIRNLGIVALASMAGFWAGNHSGELAPAGQHAAQQLATELSAASGPLVARDRRGVATHRLQYDVPRRAIVLQLDRNRDGQWEPPHLYPLGDLGVR